MVVGRVTPVDPVTVCAARGEIPTHRARPIPLFPRAARGLARSAANWRVSLELLRIAFIVSPFNLFLLCPLSTPITPHADPSRRRDKPLLLSGGKT